MASETSKSERWVGAVAAIALLLVSGTGYRLLASWYDRAPDTVVIPRGTLAALPLGIGEWIGYDDPVSERIIRKTGTDDHVNRMYERRQGRDSVSLWVAYGVRLRDLMPHRPEVCYSGAGWNVEDTKRLELRLGDGGVLPCRVIRFKRGALATERMTVLNYYIVDGEYSAGVSRLRSQASRGGGIAGYAVQVQVACGTAALHERAEDLVRAFATDSASAVSSLLIDAVESVTSAASESS